MESTRAPGPLMIAGHVDAASPALLPAGTQSVPTLARPACCSSSTEAPTRPVRASTCTAVAVTPGASTSSRTTSRSWPLTTRPRPAGASMRPLGPRMIDVDDGRGLVGVDQDDPGLAAGDGAAAHEPELRGGGRAGRARHPAATTSRVAAPLVGDQARARVCRRRRRGWRAGAGCRTPRSGPVRPGRGSSTARTPCRAASPGRRHRSADCPRRRPVGLLAGLARHDRRRDADAEVGAGARLGAQQHGGADRLDRDGPLGDLGRRLLQERREQGEDGGHGEADEQGPRAGDGRPALAADCRRRRGRRRGGSAARSSRWSPVSGVVEVRGEVDLEVLLAQLGVGGQRLSRRSDVGVRSSGVAGPRLAIGSQADLLASEHQAPPASAGAATLGSAPGVGAATSDGRRRRGRDRDRVGDVRAGPSRRGRAGRRAAARATASVRCRRTRRPPGACPPAPRRPATRRAGPARRLAARSVCVPSAPTATARHAAIERRRRSPGCARPCPRAAPGPGRGRPSWCPRRRRRAASASPP